MSGHMSHEHEIRKRNHKETLKKRRKKERPPTDRDGVSVFSLQFLHLQFLLAVFVIKTK